jgi:hypothetical protein
MKKQTLANADLILVPVLSFGFAENLVQKIIYFSKPEKTAIRFGAWISFKIPCTMDQNLGF